MSLHIISKPVSFVPHAPLLWNTGMWQITCPRFEKITPQLTTTAFCSGRSKTKCEEMKGLWRHITCWGCFVAQLKSQAWCEPCCNLLEWYNQIHPPPIFFRWVSHIHTSRQVRHMLRGFTSTMSTTQNDHGRWGYETSSAQNTYTNTQNLLFLNSLPVLTWIIQVLILSLGLPAASRRCKQSAAGMSVTILLVGMPGLLGDRLHMIEESMWSREGNKYPGVSGRYLQWSCFPCF